MKILAVEMGKKGGYEEGNRIAGFEIKVSV